MNYVNRLPYCDDVIEKLRTVITSVLAEVNSVSMIVLFGSYARCEHKVTSDLDILVLTEDKLSIELRGELASKMDVMNVDLIFYTSQEFASSESLLVRKIREDGVLLWKA